MLFQISRYLLAALYVLAGVNHFWHPGFYTRIMPTYLPAPRLLVLLSGVCEIGLGLLVLAPAPVRQWAAWGIVALLVAVLPVHIHMVQHLDRYPQYSPLLLWLRIPFQGVLMLWAYWHTRG